MDIIWILISTFIISTLAFTGVIVLSLKDEFLNKILLFLVSLSSGALLGGGFIHLLPEGIENLDNEVFFLLVLTALIVYLLIEKILHWRHCHKNKGCSIHSFGYMNLMGDSVHNFIDGLIIASAFLTDTSLGVVTTIAIAIHEIPQEIGDFGVLLHAGFSKRRALKFNFLAALTVVLGGLAGWFLNQYTNDITKWMIPIAAGGFIYIALSDLIPEIRKEEKIGKFLLNFLFMMLGIVLMYIIKFIL